MRGPLARALSNPGAPPARTARDLNAQQATEASNPRASGEQASGHEGSALGMWLRRFGWARKIPLIHSLYKRGLVSLGVKKLKISH